jgi:tRNA threonylcarbamoyladenosine biosynthesis protein TsaB
MMQLLAVETSSTNCSVALFNNAELVDCLEINDGYSHAENLAVLTDRLLDTNGSSFSELTHLAVGIGPGSYTGLRIGVSFIKGLAYSLQLPVISVPSTEVIFATVKNQVELNRNDAVVAMIDARRMEAYVQSFAFSGEKIGEIQAEILEVSAFETELAEFNRVFLAGSGAEKFYGLGLSKRHFLVEGVLPTAKFMGDYSLKQIEKQAFEDAAYFEPFYLKEFVAGKPKRDLLRP